MPYKEPSSGMLGIATHFVNVDKLTWMQTKAPVNNRNQPKKVQRVKSGYKGQVRRQGGLDQWKERDQ